MSSCCKNNIILGLLVRCLLGHFLFGLVLLLLPVRPLLGGCQSGQVARLVTGSVGAVQEVVADGACREVHWVSGSGPQRKRIRQNRKTRAHLAGLVVQSRPRV